MRFDLLIVLIGIIGLQALISCSPDVIEDETPPSSSSLLFSSSSKTPSSSSSLDCSTISSSSISEDLCLDFDPDTEVEHYGKMKKQFCDERDGKKYVYVQIGEQTWMAENLNHDVCGSKCGEKIPEKYYDIPFLEDTNTEACDKYGRLYDWRTALTVCPNGWHLPDKEEWIALMDYIGGEKTAGDKLKTIKGWRLSFYESNYSCMEEESIRSMLAREYVMESLVDCGVNGTDDYGFSALSGGQSFGGRFYPMSGGNWWLVEYKGISLGNSFAHYWFIDRSGSYAKVSSKVEAGLLSVRCIKDPENIGKKVKYF